MWCVRSSVAPEKIIELQLILLDQEVIYLFILLCVFYYI
jgi:hypothetical protein